MTAKLSLFCGELLGRSKKCEISDVSELELGVVVVVAAVCVEIPGSTGSPGHFEVTDLCT